MKFPKERVTPCIKRAYVYSGFAISRDHFLPVQLITFEFLRRGILIFDSEPDLFAGRDSKLGWLESVILDNQCEVIIGS